MRIIFLLAMLFIVLHFADAQVVTNFNSTRVIDARGKFRKSFKEKVPHFIPSKDVKMLLEKEVKEDGIGEAKPFKFAEPVKVDIDVIKEAAWVEDNGYAHGKYTIVAAGAKSISANFDQFRLPKQSELYIYSENGEMISGPVTEKENNDHGFWGTWVYKGEKLTVDFKVPIPSREELRLHISSVAYGYKDIYRTEVGIYNFGNSEPCNINVLCALGIGWEKERNSTVLILNRASSSFCSGALINNTSNLDIPYILTANHCFVSNDGNNDPSEWKFTFQAWSPTCTPTQNAEGITFNGATLKARSAKSDFCLVQMNTPPPASLCITAAGWSRNTTNVQQTTVIHHPVGDVMKISRDNKAPVFDVFNNAQCWRLNLDLGATQGGSSGGPYFDQNHRIIAQHFGTGPTPTAPLDPTCDNRVKFGGRFDISWTGDGTSSTRLSNWLDPSRTNTMTTDARLSGLSILGSNFICSSTGQFQATGSVTWSSSDPSILSINSSSGLSTSPSNLNGGVIITATSTGCGSFQPLTIKTFVGAPLANNSTVIYPSGQRSIDPVTLCAGCTYNFLVDYVEGATSYTWILPTGFSFISGENTSTPGIRTSTISGTYTLYCSANNLCGSSYTHSLIINIGGGGQQQRISVYPNPTSNNLTIESAGSSLAISDANLVEKLKSGEVEDFSVKLLSPLNLVLMSRESENGKIVFDVSNLQNGLYYLHILKGQELSIQQILISR